MVSCCPNRHPRSYNRAARFNLKSMDYTVQDYLGLKGLKWRFCASQSKLLNISEDNQKEDHFYIKMMREAEPLFKF